MKKKRVGFVLLLSAMSVACVPEGATLECQISHVAGKFTTTQKEMRWAGNQRGRDPMVTMYRGERVFMWPLDRVVGCEEIEKE